MQKQNAIKKFIKENWMLILAIVYLLSPLDFIPDLLPALGFADDIAALLVALIIKIIQFKVGNPKESENIIDGEVVEKKKEENGN